ncbi:similar to Saccharomyces cerevisiae YBR120C CBP6 Mitochondrial protein required for translation of the COB mRNA [Maudiozyma saulgeensis]|uniref:Similar to Saccharomyces cerevisiae YBR120C CBP6 Mitochondrial protein required for translation of the COB mRNA n=1 Tax=Maudiozyma saulgeensis TaxID=1789683 RepID=A0A1X7QX60_9SACH|nr:similar to Saccharomyces cerevisiae YBR120C CBP6 Mitochondrial protein required for translation of the COB mRNA [Kazachstania saulgeensis]
MSSYQVVREGAKQVIKLLEKFPEERFKYLVSFKATQLERFSRIAGLPISQKSSSEIANNKASIDEIKDIVNRTSGPLGLQKEMLKKMQAAIPHDQFSEASMKDQINALSNLVGNKYKNYYEVGNKLYNPAGNPEYYQRIIDDIQGKKKENILAGLRTVFMGR